LLKGEDKTMGTYQIRRITYETVDMDKDDLMTLSEAARELGLSLQTVRTNAEAGRMTLVIDPDRNYQARRLVLRSEVEALKKERETE
jgi:hypothetical protein